MKAPENCSCWMSSANPATHIGKVLTPTSEYVWHREDVITPNHASLNQGPRIDLIRDVEQHVVQLGAIIAPEGLQFEADGNLFFEPTELRGPRYNRRYSTQALRTFARGICYFFLSEPLWTEPDMDQLARMMELTLAEIRRDIADGQLNETLSALFDPTPPQAQNLNLYVIQQNAMRLREAIDEEHAACPLIEAVLKINATDDATLIQSVLDSATPWETYVENGRPLGRVFEWQVGLGKERKSCI